MGVYPPLSVSLISSDIDTAVYRSMFALIKLPLIFSSFPHAPGIPFESLRT